MQLQSSPSCASSCLSWSERSIQIFWDHHTLPIKTAKRITSGFPVLQSSLLGFYGLPSVKFASKCAGWPRLHDQKPVLQAVATQTLIPINDTSTALVL